MDPITTAIIAALAAGAASGVTEVGKQAIVDGYNALKSAIQRKFGADSKLAAAVDDLEKEPEFKPNQEALVGRVAQVDAAADAELKQLAQALLDTITAQPGGDQIIKTATGHRGDIIQQKAGDGALQIGKARDVTVGPDKRKK